MEETKDYNVVTVEARVPKVVDVVIPGAKEVDCLVATPGPKGDKGDKGDPGEPGKPFTYADFTPEQLASLKGQKGDKGDPFTYSDFTQEQLNALKGAKGDKGEPGPPGPPGVGGSGGASVDLSQYAKKVDLNIYLSKINAENTYVSKTAAESYATRSWAVSVFPTKATLNDYQTVKDANNLYLKKVDLGNYLTMLGDSKYILKSEINKYITNSGASTSSSSPTSGGSVDLSAYTTKKDADKLYMKKVDIGNFIKMYSDPVYALKTDLNNYVKKSDLSQSSGGLDANGLKTAFSKIGLYCRDGADVYTLLTDALIAVKNGADIGDSAYWSAKQASDFFRTPKAGDTKIQGAIPNGFFVAFNGRNKERITGRDALQTVTYDIPSGVDSFTVSVFLPNGDKINDYTIQIPKYTIPEAPGGSTLSTQYTDDNGIKWTIYNIESFDSSDDIAYGDLDDIHSGVTIDTLDVQHVTNLKRVVLYSLKPVTVYTPFNIKAPSGATLEWHNKDLITVIQQVDTL